MSTRKNFDIIKIGNWTLTVINSFATISGFLIGFVSVITREELSWKVMVAIIIFNFLLILGSGIYLTVFKYKYNSMVEKNIQETEKILNVNNILKNNIDVFINFNYYINDTLNQFLNKLHIKTDKYLEDRENLDNLKKEVAEGEDDLIVNRAYYIGLRTLNVRQYQAVMGDIKQFLRTMLDKTKDAMEAYIRSKGIAANVSLCVKQLSNKYYIGDDYKNILVSNLFRDSCTYETNKDREIGKISYNINSNSGFIHCIQNSFYLNNNLEKANGSYLNPNKNFLDYYDAVLMVPIQCEFEDTKVYYGFLACDTKKPEDMHNEEMFDEKLRKILCTCSSIIGMYFEDVDYAMSFLLGEHEYEDFLAVAFQNKFENKTA